MTLKTALGFGTVAGLGASAVGVVVAATDGGDDVEGSDGAAGQVAERAAAGRRQVQSMSEVPRMGLLQDAVYFTAQSSLLSSAAAAQTWPKLSQYRSHRPPLEPSTRTKAVQVSPHVTPRSTSGHLLYGAQHASSAGGFGPGLGRLGPGGLEPGQVALEALNCWLKELP
mmetsp:Transcript_73850/g.220366  ORF Transcript_73850/g.220366 Transcript_73850/m.220366 type:complete len:169 (+) Transcript_73850:1001-1507(+)